MHEPRSVVLRFYELFHAGDLEAVCDLLDPDVEYSADTEDLRGCPAVRGFLTALRDRRPDLAVAPAIVAADGGTVVAELRRGPRAAGPGPPGPGGERASACEVFRVRDGRILAIRSYSTSDPADGTAAPPLPSRLEAWRMSDEQAALRRVATLVAQGASQDEVFAAVNEEIARIVRADATSLMRFEPDDTLMLVAAWHARGVSLPIGDRRPLNAEMREVRATGRPRRFDELPPTGPFLQEAKDVGVRWVVTVPIAVAGGVWGVVFATSEGPEPFPDDTEARIARFTELLTAALASAQARVELQDLVDEQAALRRVAELVARGAAPEEVLAAVAVEASALLGDTATSLLRFEEDGTFEVVAQHHGPGPVGLRLPHEAGSLPAVVRETGRPAREAPGDGVPAGPRARAHGTLAAAGVPITVDGRIWGMLTATTPDRSLPAGTEDRLAQFSELVAAAIANAAHRAQLTASRARMMATADDVRRRLQRDVHDGAQQRLVQTVITLKLARAALDDGGHAAAAALVDESLAHAQRATSELRDIVHGILPASLSRGGLRGGVESLIASHPLPVSASIDVPRLAPATETTAYFVIAEALTNVVKHAGATRAEVSAGVNGRWLTVMVRDDGAGGAVPARGSGLTGLYDRVEAGEGTLTVTSPPGRGTTVRAVLPVEAPVPTASADGQAELPLG